MNKKENEEEEEEESNAIVEMATPNNMISRQ